MYRALKTGINVLKASDSDNLEVQKIFVEWTKDNLFSRKAKMYCALYNDTPELLEECSFIENKFREYHTALGKEGFEALYWREDYIKQALAPTPFGKLPKSEIAKRLMKALNVSQEYTKSEIKELLQKIYKELDIQGKPSASDIANYLTCEDRTSKVKRKLTAVFRITSHTRRKVSFFKKITDVLNPQVYDIDKLLEIIRDDTYYHLKPKIEAVRKAKSKEEKAKKKALLPAITWNGVFKSKNKNECVLYSSFTALDFDHIEPENMKTFAGWLQGFPCVYAYFVTPSGTGFKAIILHDNYEPLYHYDLYNQLLKLLQVPPTWQEEISCPTTLNYGKILIRFPFTLFHQHRNLYCQVSLQRPL